MEGGIFGRKNKKAYSLSWTLYKIQYLTAASEIKVGCDVILSVDFCADCVKNLRRIGEDLWRGEFWEEKMKRPIL